MRLAILDRGHSLGTKILFLLIRAASRQPVLDVIKLVKYRADFYGKPMQGVTQEAMRGPSAWPVADRELMAAFVAKTNDCEWCMKAHAAVAEGAYRDGAIVSAVLSDFETAPIEEPLRATLRMLCRLIREHAVNADDMRAVIVAGAPANRSRMPSPFASRSTQSAGWPMPSDFFCPVPRPLRLARSICSRAVTGDIEGVDCRHRDNWPSQGN